MEKTTETFHSINVSDHHFGILHKEFDCSRQTIYVALKDKSKSELAKNIRSRAKELLLEEANAI